MRKIREILRLKFELGRTHRQIASSCGLGVASISDYLKRARDSGVAWADAQRLSDAELEARLFHSAQYGKAHRRAVIDFGWVHSELRRTGVTLQLLWSEYVEAAHARRESEPYQYSQFCERYKRWRSQLDIVMRQSHRAGEKAFIDYSGKKPTIVDPLTGEVIEVELFVMVLGASNYTYAEATLTQKVRDFAGSIVRGLEYFGGVVEVLVPDQLRSAVKGPDRYDPEINQTLVELAKHYDTAIIPARPRKPRDKAKVETGVLVAQRMILARLRNLKFFSLDELNQAIGERLDELNERPFKKLEGSRKSAFESIDRPALKPLPTRRYEPREWARARVNIDYHVTFDHRLYSVPHSLVGERVELCVTANTVEIFHGGQRVVTHRRSFGRKGTAVTCDHHRPESHQDYGKWPPERLLSWGAKFGPSVRRVVEMTMARYPRPEMGFRAALGVLRSAERHGSRFDEACARALHVSGESAPRRKFIEALLKHDLDRAPIQVLEEPRPHVHHENVRGGAYYEKEKQHAD